MGHNPRTLRNGKTYLISFSTLEREKPGEVLCLKHQAVNPGDTLQKTKSWGMCLTSWVKMEDNKQIDGGDPSEGQDVSHETRARQIRYESDGFR